MNRLMIRVEDIDLEGVKSISQLCEALLNSGGFMAKNLGLAVKVLCEMFRDEDCLRLLSFTGNTMATGLRGVYRLMVKKRLVDVVITTTAALDHDLARSWADYYHGEFRVKDSELRRRRIHRLGNIYLPFKNYGELIEKRMRELLDELWEEGVKEISTHELCREIGLRIVSKDSFLYWAAKRNVPVIVPGPLDGAVGGQIWFFQQAHRDFKLNLFKDEELMSNFVFEAKRTGGVIIGGGISKHHLLWWNQFRGGLDYAIQITTAVELDGSLSGAQLEEAISWRKVKAGARVVNVWADATIALPLIVKAALEELGK